MGFHGYGGSELDHSDCLISPCSECNRQRQQPQPSVRSGNTCTDLTSNQDDRGSRANVFGHENSDRNATYRATGSDNAAGGADCAGNLSGGFHHLSISEEDRILRDEMRQSGFRIPSFSEDPASSHPVGNQNRGEDTVFECQNHPQPNDGRGGLSDEDRALRNEMRRSGFRIPSVSFDPTSGHPDGSLNHGGSVGFQTQNQYQADNNNTTSASAAGSLSPRSFASNDTGYNSCPCITNSGRRCGIHMEYTEYEPEVGSSSNIVAPWAFIHPTTQETLDRVLRNKALAYGRSQESAGIRRPSTQPGTPSQGGTGRPEVSMNRRHGWMKPRWNLMRILTGSRPLSVAIRAMTRVGLRRRKSLRDGETY